MGVVWCNGRFLNNHELKVSAFDRGLCQGLSLFETILSVNGRPRLVTEHLDRLRLGLERLGVLSVELADDALRNAMIALLEKNNLTAGTARIRFAVSLGDGSLNRIDCGSAWVWMTASEVGEISQKIKMTLAPWRRDTESVLRGLKVGNYAEHLIAMDLARREGCDEMLFYNTSDEVCEAAMANIFLIRGGCIFTPSLESGCLAGVTRALVMRLAAEHGIPCQEKPLSRADVKKSDGFFLTSSVKGPVWVSEFQGRSYEEHALFGAIRRLWAEEMTSANR